jgi:hypothetical protein
VSELPELLDSRRLQRELGVTRAAAEAIMRRLPVVQIEGLRKTYVRRSDVGAYLEARTFAKSEVPASRGITADNVSACLTLAANRNERSSSRDFTKTESGGPLPNRRSKKYA